MNEGERSRKIRKTGKPKVIKKFEVGVPKSEEEYNSAFDITNSDLQEPPTANSSRQLLGLQNENMEVHHHPEVEKKVLRNICFKA